MSSSKVCDQVSGEDVSQNLSKITKSLKIFITTAMNNNTTCSSLMHPFPYPLY